MNTSAPPVLYYRDADFLVTSAKVKSPRKTYRVDRIEKVSIRRDPFYIGLAISIVYALFALKFGKYLTVWLIPIGWSLFTAAYFLKSYSLLFITSKAVSEFAFFGRHERLEKVRSGIEKAMHKEDQDDGFASHADDSDDD